ncbi:MAG: TMEM175 family protein [Rhizomicrobium sp.]
MTNLYNRIAGRSADRLAALSDGVFAFAMTVLALDLHVPAAFTIHSEAELGHALIELSPRLLTYLMSFLTLGIFWVGQNTQHDLLKSSDRGYAWIHIAFLMAVTLVPFSTSLLAEFITYRIALLVYWGNIAFLGATLLAAWYRARAMDLVKPDAPEGSDRALVRRVVLAQILYAAAASLCLVSNYWSIGLIVAIQLQYAIGLRFRPFSWIG